MHTVPFARLFLAVSLTSLAFTGCGSGESIDGNKDDTALNAGIDFGLSLDDQQLLDSLTAACKENPASCAAAGDFKPGATSSNASASSSSSAPTGDSSASEGSSSSSEVAIESSSSSDAISSATQNSSSSETAQSSSSLSSSSAMSSSSSKPSSSSQAISSSSSVPVSSSSAPSSSSAATPTGCPVTLVKGASDTQFSSGSCAVSWTETSFIRIKYTCVQGGIAITLTPDTGTAFVLPAANNGNESKDYTDNVPLTFSGTLSFTSTSTCSLRLAN